MIDAVIFDMDGVLIDTVEAAHQVKTKILKDHYDIDINGVPDPHQEAHRGSSVRTFLQAVEKSHGLRIPEEEFAEHSVPAIKELLQHFNPRPDPGLLTFLQELQRHQVPLAIATSGLKQSVANKLQLLGIGDFFQVVTTAHDVERHKPHPDVYLTTMQRLGADPTRTIVFEDSKAGLAAGLAAGATVVGLTKFNSQLDSLTAAALVISDWPEIDYQKLVDLLAKHTSKRSAS